MSAIGIPKLKSLRRVSHRELYQLTAQKPELRDLVDSLFDLTGRVVNLIGTDELQTQYGVSTAALVEYNKERNLMQARGNRGRKWRGSGVRGRNQLSVTLSSGLNAKVVDFIVTGDVVFTQVSSSHLSAIGYDSQARMAWVLFQNGSAYEYLGVSAGEMDAWLRSTGPGGVHSFGAYFWEHIRGDPKHGHALKPYRKIIDPSRMRNYYGS